jgi:DNA-binding NtrC family response regulator
VIVVDDDTVQCMVLRRVLETSGHSVACFHDGTSCFAGLSELLPECMVLDLKMPGLSGLEVLERVRARLPQLPVIVVTADEAVDSVVGAMRLGAYDYLVKPIDPTRFTTAVRNAVERNQLQRRLQRLERESQQSAAFGMVGVCPAMKQLFADIDRLAATDITVLIHGESGTGKELVARAVHDRSSRARGPYLALNCAAIPHELLESELFGHEKGAFTGAGARHEGVIERADGGTLLLDEIAELSLPVQAKLLRVLQERRCARVGGTAEVASDRHFGLFGKRGWVAWSRGGTARLKRSDAVLSSQVVDLGIRK